jgi:hypothetical protein
MMSDKVAQENTKALNRLVSEMASLGKVCAELNKNLVVLGRLLREQQEPGELHGQCYDYRCSYREMHNHGVQCGPQCPCKRVIRSPKENPE